jgi:hypothetical protein
VLPSWKADGEVERVVLGEPPVGGERRLDLEVRGVTMYQHVPRLVRQDQPGALAVEIHVDVGHGVGELDAQGVGALLGEGRRRHRRAGGREHCGTAGKFHEKPPVFGQA